MKKFNQFREDSLLEVLKASDPTGKWIHDFVHSDNPKFAGKSKKERIRMALGAAYASKRNEEVDLEEAIKLGTKVKMHAPGKDYHDLVGSIGEIRHGAFKGAPKTYTVDYGNGKSVQLSKQNVKLHKEEAVAEGYNDLGREYGGAYVKGRSDDARMTEKLTRQAKAAAAKAGKTFNTSAEYRKWHAQQKEKQGTVKEDTPGQAVVAEARKPEKDDSEPHPIHGDIGLTKGDVRDTAYNEGERHAAGNKHGSNAKAWGPEAKHYSAGFMAGRNDSDKWHKKMSKITRTEETLSELNKDTVYSYSKKAEADQDKQFTTIGKALKNNDPKSGNTASHKFTRRSLGINRAETRLNKEDTEVAEARMSAAQRLWNAENKQRAKSDASLARTPSSIPKPEEKK